MFRRVSAISSWLLVVLILTLVGGSIPPASPPLVVRSAGIGGQVSSPSAQPADPKGTALPALLDPTPTPESESPPLPPPHPITVPPVTEPHLPSLLLDAALAPNPVAVGDTVGITLTVTNQAPDPAQNVVVTLPLPDGAVALPGPGLVSGTGGWAWTIPLLGGRTTTIVTATLRLASSPTGSALRLTAETTAQGVPLPVTVRRGAVVVNRTQGAGTALFQPGSATTLRSADNRVEVQIPAGVLSRSLTLQHIPQWVKQATVSAPASPTPTPTRTAAVTGTVPALTTPTGTPSPTSVATPPSSTPTTVVTATSTPTPTSLMPATSTATPTATPTASPTSTISGTATVIGTATPVLTTTAVVTTALTYPSMAGLSSPAGQALQLAAVTTTVAVSSTPAPTNTATATPLPSSTPTETVTVTATPSSTPAAPATPTTTAPAPATSTLTPSPTMILPAVTPTATATPTRVATLTPTVTMGVTATATLPVSPTVTPISGSAAGLPPPNVGYKPGFDTFFLEASDAAGQPVHHFAQPVTLRYHYTPEQLQALDLPEESLTFFWFDEGTHHWVSLETQIDRATHTASTQVDHFTAFQLTDGVNESSLLKPSLQGWQVSLFTGAVSFAYPIDVPAGPGGLKPNLQLSYSSAATDGPIAATHAKLQAGWVGKGWSLDTGYIVRNKVTIPSDWLSAHGGSPFFYYYTLVFDGHAYDLVRNESLGNGNINDPTQWMWRSTDESYIKVRAYANGTSTLTGSPDDRGGYIEQNGVKSFQTRYKWQVQTKDGMLYEFSEDLWWGWEGCFSETTIEPYKWLLTKVTDPHGNTITYNYDRDSVSPNSFTCNNLTIQGVVDRDAWPTSITWGGNPTTSPATPDRYKVEFKTSARQYDTQPETVNGQYDDLEGTPRQTQQLDTITVSSIVTSTWEQVRQYRLTYDDTLTSDKSIETPAGSGLWYSDTANPKLTLRTLQQVGTDAGAALSVMSFSYGARNSTAKYPGGGWNRLTSIDNGYGGTITYTYEDIGGVASVLANQNHEAFDNNHRVISKTVHSGAGQSYDQSSTWTYSYGTPNYNSIGLAVTTAGYTQDGSAYIGGLTQNPTSAAIYFNRMAFPSQDNRAWLGHQAMTEFRGHDYVKETDPSGAQIEHWFYQGGYYPGELGYCDYPRDVNGNPLTGDGALYSNACFQGLRDHEFLKGREYRTRTLTSAGAVLQETQHSFATNFLAYCNCSNGEQLTGVWRAFSYESQTVATSSEGGAIPLSKTTSYLYDFQDNTNSNSQPYGNLSRITEYDGANAVVRITKHFYAIQDTPTAYLVDRKWADMTWDGSWRVLAYTAYFYDGATTQGGIGTRGDLTRISKFSDIPLQSTLDNLTLHSTDTTYTYDSYGNRTTETTYAGPGTSIFNGSVWTFSAAGSGTAARTTTTTYDTLFHVYPVRVDPPSVNGVTLTEQAGYDYRLGTMTVVTDTNGNPTIAQYDGLGRMTKLVKWGDSTTTATSDILYYDTARPFRIIVAKREISGQSGNRPLQYLYDGLGRTIQTKSESLDGTQNIVVDTLYDGLNRVTQQSQPRYVNETVSDTFWGYTPQTKQAPDTLVWTTTSYDALGRVFEVRQPDNTKAQHHYGVVQEGSMIWSYHDIVDANRHRIQYRYDALGRLTQVDELSGNCGSYWADYVCGGAYTTGWGVYASTTYTYSPLDLLTSVTDAKGNSTTVSYDSLGRKIGMIDPDMGSWSYSYDVNGNLVSQTDAKGQVTSFAYDALNRLTSKTAPELSASYGYDEATSTNGKGQRTSMSTSAATTRWSYDGRGRMTRAEYTVAGLSGTRIFSTTYDSADRITTLTYPNNEVMTYSYDAAWHPTHLSSSIDGSLVSSASYSALDQPTRLASAAIVTWTYSSPLQRLSNLKIGSTSGLYTFMDRSYSYDAGGNVASITNNMSGDLKGYTYDERDRLTQYTLTPAQGSSVTEAYSYNTIGNLMSKSGVGYTYPATGSAHPHAATSVGGSTNTYTYDANGNLVTGGGRSYTWRVDNLPSSIQGTDGITETYGYDADGERLTKTRNGVTTVYLNGLREEVIGGGTLSYYLFNGNVIALRSGPSYVAPTYLFGDHLGSVSVAVNNSTGQVTTQEYDPWGKVLSGNITGVALNYTEQRLDSTGLLYYHARYYDPGLARFVSADAIVPSATSGSRGSVASLDSDASVKLTPLTVDFHESGFSDTAALENRLIAARGFFDLPVQATGPLNPQALNRYSAVLNNPLRWTDPTGHDSCADIDPAECKYGNGNKGLPGGGNGGWWQQQFNKAKKWLDENWPGGQSKSQSCSFSADTIVMTEEGDRAISEIKVGDRVLAYDEETGRTGYYTVTAVLVHRDPGIEELTIDGERVTTTPEHPFFTREQGWVPAGKLLIGMHIRKADGSYGPVQSFQIVQRPQVMYNLTVANAHTFFVGKDHWLVHNSCLPVPSWVTNGGAVVNWAKQLQEEYLATNRVMTKEELDELVQLARKYGVEIRYDKEGHAGTRWEMPHLNIGRGKSTPHIPVPKGYQLPPP